MEERQSGILPFCNNFSKNAIEERITAIMKTKKITIFSFAAACLIVCGIVTTFATSAKTGKLFTGARSDRQRSGVMEGAQRAGQGVLGRAGDGYARKVRLSGCPVRVFLSEVLSDRGGKMSLPPVRK